MFKKVFNIPLKNILRFRLFKNSFHHGILSVLSQKRESQNGCFKKTKIWRALLSLSTRVDIHPFALLPTIYNLIVIAQFFSKRICIFKEYL